MNKIQDLQQFKEDYIYLSSVDLVKKYGLHYVTLLKYAKKLGINRKSGERKKYKVNDSYFTSSNTDKSNKYYILGVIYTDGNLPVKNKNSFIISNIDKNLLLDISKELEYTGPLTTEYHKIHKKYIYKLQITSEQIRKDLENIGLTTNKTMSLSFPNIPIEYLKDFSRGLWDGDGSVSMCNSKNNTKLLKSNFVCASEAFIKDFVKILPVKNKKIKVVTKNRLNPLYHISLRGFDSLRLKEFFYYQNCLSMKRKENLFFSYKPRRSENTISNP